MAIPATPSALQKRAQAILRPFVPKELEYRLGITKEPPSRISFGQRLARGSLRLLMPRQMEYSLGLRPRKFAGLSRWERKVRSYIPLTKERKKTKAEMDKEFTLQIKKRAYQIIGKPKASKEEWKNAEAQALREMHKEALAKGYLMGGATRTKEGTYKKPLQMGFLEQYVHKIK